jgi:DNA end-binding protein Ku
MPRAIWSGSIAFGLVNAPVRMYSAIDEHDLDLHLVHEKDGSRIGYEKYCKLEEKPVPNDEIVKGYELDGELVYLDEDDFAAAESDGYRTIEILAFVPADAIDPIYFERSFYLGPQESGEKVYRLLVAAMEEAGLVGVVRYVFHDRQQLGALRVRDAMLVLARMHYADEIRPVDDIVPDGKAKVDDRELDLAVELVQRFSGKFEPESYRDVYRERLLEVIERKRRGGETAPVRPEEPAAPPDLLEALRESLRRHASGNGSSGSRAARGSSADHLQSLTVDELHERARKLAIPGRSKMSKRELVSAIESAGE